VVCLITSVIPRAPALRAARADAYPRRQGPAHPLCERLLRQLLRRDDRQHDNALLRHHLGVRQGDQGLIPSGSFWFLSLLFDVILACVKETEG